MWSYTYIVQYDIGELKTPISVHYQLTCQLFYIHVPTSGKWFSEITNLDFFLKGAKMKKLKSIISDLILQRSGWYLFFLSVQLASMLIAEKFKTI